MNLNEAIQKLLYLKYFELKAKASWLEIEHVVSYLKDVVLRKTKVHSLNEAAYYIMNIKINMVIEYLNVNAILDKSESIESDFLEIMKG